MFFHIKIEITALDYWSYYNQTREEVFTEFLCPFINREVTLLENKIFNMSSFGSIRVFQTEKPVNSDWPVKKEDFENTKQTMWERNYKRAIHDFLESNEVTQEFFREAIILIETGKYKEHRKEILEATKGKYSFFICPLENAEVNHNYEFVIKPIVKQYQFEIQKADEISHAKPITDEILKAIGKSRFIVADLTDSRPNCYYEVGYAHSLGKPVILLAKEGTERHFDISVYKWNYWKDYKELKPKFEKEILSILRNLGYQI